MALQAGERIKVEGLSDLEEAFAFLSRSAAAAVLRNAAKDALIPFDQAWRQLVAPHHLTGALEESGGVGTRLSRNQASQVRAEGKDFVEVYAGPGPNPQGIMLEFGTRHQRPFPFMRPAWDATHDEVLVRLIAGLQASLDRINDTASARLASNAARDFKRNG